MSTSLQPVTIIYLSVIFGLSQQYMRDRVKHTEIQQVLPVFLPLILMAVVLWSTHKWTVQLQVGYFLPFFLMQILMHLSCISSHRVLIRPWEITRLINSVQLVLTPLYSSASSPLAFHSQPVSLWKAMEEYKWGSSTDRIWEVKNWIKGKAKNIQIRFMPMHRHAGAYYAHRSRFPGFLPVGTLGMLNCS